MDMELQQVTLGGYRPSYHTAFTQEETLESIVPDALPDVSRIVGAWGRACLKERAPPHRRCPGHRAVHP